MGADLFPLAADLEAARSQMAFTLGFHIILASMGVAFPAIILTANYIGLRRGDEDALRLAQRWSKVAAVLFAVGAITGTVLSFEMGLLWPEFMSRFGEVFGPAFALEGVFFFLEAIFMAIYIFGWKRLRPWVHFWTGVPVVLSGLGGALSVVAVNAWMNTPGGFKVASDGSLTDVDPVDALLSPAVAYEAPHMILAAYMVAGFLVASVYAVGMLRGRRDRHHRLGLLIPLTLAAIVTPIQLGVGDTAAREIAKDQPVKFAGMECVQKTSTHVTEYIFGRCTSDGVKGGIGIPGLDSWLVGFSTDTKVIGLRLRPAGRPPAREHDAPLGLRHHGGHRHRPDGARAVARSDVALPARHAQIALVPARHRRVGRGGVRGARVRLDRDGGGPPALDRLQRDAHGGCRDRCERRVDQPLSRAGAVCRRRDRDRVGAAGDDASLADGRARRGRGALRAAPGPA